MRTEKELIELLISIGFEPMHGDSLHMSYKGNCYHIRQAEEILTKNGVIPNFGGWF